jgi:hypothetical protein
MIAAPRHAVAGQIDTGDLNVGYADIGPAEECRTPGVRTSVSLD